MPGFKFIPAYAGQVLFSNIVHLSDVLGSQLFFHETSIYPVISNDIVCVCVCVCVCVRGSNSFVCSVLC